MRTADVADYRNNVFRNSGSLMSPPDHVAV
jgi:hypothetical protein